jgi:hypothetical protein
MRRGDSRDSFAGVRRATRGRFANRDSSGWSHSSLADRSYSLLTNRSQLPPSGSKPDALAGVGPDANPIQAVVTTKKRPEAEAAGRFSSREIGSGGPIRPVAYGGACACREDTILLVRARQTQENCRQFEAHCWRDMGTGPLRGSGVQAAFWRAVRVGTSYQWPTRRPLVGLYARRLLNPAGWMVRRGRRWNDREHDTQRAVRSTSPTR